MGDIARLNLRQRALRLLVAFDRRLCWSGRSGIGVLVDVVERVVLVAFKRVSVPVLTHRSRLEFHPRGMSRTRCRVTTRVVIFICSKKTNCSLHTWAPSCTRELHRLQMEGREGSEEN